MQKNEDGNMIKSILKILKRHDGKEEAIAALEPYISTLGQYKGEEDNMEDLIETLGRFDSLEDIIAKLEAYDGDSDIDEIVDYLWDAANVSDFIKGLKRFESIESVVKALKEYDGNEEDIEEITGYLCEESKA